MVELVNTLQETVAVLTLRVKQLEDRLGKDSHNSSELPSSDGYKKPSPKSQRGKSGPPGGQSGRFLSAASHKQLPGDSLLFRDARHVERARWERMEQAGSSPEIGSIPSRRAWIRWASRSLSGTAALLAPGPLRGFRLQVVAARAPKEIDKD